MVETTEKIVIKKRGSNYDRAVVLDEKKHQSVYQTVRKLFDQKGILKESLNVPAQTVTRIYNEEYEHALVNKNIDFLTKGIPGLGEPSVYVDIRILRKK